MGESPDILLSKKEKDMYIKALSEELALLRAKAEASQEDIANIIGVSRQTYGAIERKTRKMTWNMYLTLIWFYDYNRKTHKMIRSTNAFPHKLVKKFNDGDEPQNFELGLLFRNDKKNIFESLDEQAISTIRTVLMLEYSRCNNISGEAVVKFFEGFELQNKENSINKSDITRALKNLKKDKQNDKQTNQEKSKKIHKRSSSKENFI